MMEPLFSVIIPVFNEEKYLAKCLDSVLEQTFPFFEVVACNDGSSDKSLEILKEYEQKDERIHVLNQKNLGVTAARQNCLNVSRGSYIVCVDSDDYLESNCLEEFVKAIDTTDSDIICCGFNRVYKKKIKSEPVRFPNGTYEREAIEKEVFPIIFEADEPREIRMTFWAKAVRKTIFESEHKLLPVKVKIGEDNAVMIPCFYRANKITVLPTCLYNYRMSDNSVINSGKPRSWDQLKVRVRHYKERVDLNSFNLYGSFCRSVVHSLFNCAVTQFYGKEKTKAIKADILKHINDPVYRKIIQNCTFPEKSKGALALDALKNERLSRMHLYSVLKKGRF